MRTVCAFVNQNESIRNSMKPIRSLASKWLFCFFLLVFYPPGHVKAQFTADLETGLVFTGRNDVRIPGTGGTFISFSDELESDPDLFLRVRLGYRFNPRHEILALYAPLTVAYKGAIDRDVIFQGETYEPGKPLSASYRFNSYRATYRYFLVVREKLAFALGPTIKIRDARIGLSQDRMASDKPDLGAVPLLHFHLHWKPARSLGVLLEGDALAAPQGRAEDVLLGLTCEMRENITLKAGYRILEGGADNASVFTFSLFHYGLVGVHVSF